MRCTWGRATLCNFLRLIFQAIDFDFPLQHSYYCLYACRLEKSYLPWPTVIQECHAILHGEMHSGEMHNASGRLKLVICDSLLWVWYAERDCNASYEPACQCSFYILSSWRSHESNTRPLVFACITDTSNCQVRARIRLRLWCTSGIISKYKSPWQSSLLHKVVLPADDPPDFVASCRGIVAWKALSSMSLYLQVYGRNSWRRCCKGHEMNLSGLRWAACELLFWRGYRCAISTYLAVWKLVDIASRLSCCSAAFKTTDMLSCGLTPVLETNFFALRAQCAQRCNRIIDTAWRSDCDKLHALCEVSSMCSQLIMWSISK